MAKKYLLTLLLLLVSAIQTCAKDTETVSPSMYMARQILDSESPSYDLDLYTIDTAIEIFPEFVKSRLMAYVAPNVKKLVNPDALTVLGIIRQATLDMGLPEDLYDDLSELSDPEKAKEIRKKITDPTVADKMDRFMIKSYGWKDLEKYFTVIDFEKDAPQKNQSGAWKGAIMVKNPKAKHIKEWDVMKEAVSIYLVFDTAETKDNIEALKSRDDMEKLKHLRLNEEKASYELLKEFYRDIPIVKLAVDYSVEAMPGYVKRTSSLLWGYEDSVQLVKEYIKQGADINERNDQGETVLNRAAAEGNIEMLKALIEANADLLLPNRDGLSPLHRAAANGHAKAVQLLIDAGALVESQNDKGETPLIMAADQGHRDVVDVLLKAGADPFVSDIQNKNALHKAAEKGHEEVVRAFLSNKKLLEEKDENQNTPVQLAVENNKNKVSVLLFQAGADPETQDENGKTPLHKAVKAQNAQIIQLLVQSKKGLNTQDKEGNTPLLVSVIEGLSPFAEGLVQAGSDVNLRNKKGNAAIHIAAEKGMTKTVKALMIAKALLDEQNEEGLTPLHYAAQNGHAKIVNYFVSSKADTNKKTNKGETALLLAVESKSAKTVKILLLEDILNVPDEKGRTPLHAAIEKDYLKIGLALIKAGADPDLEDNNEKTAYDYAKSGRAKAILDLGRKMKKEKKQKEAAKKNAKEEAEIEEKASSEAKS